MFQGHLETISAPFPSKGMSVNGQNDPNYSKFVKNILVSDDNSGKLRYGTELFSKPQINLALSTSDVKHTIKDIIQIITFLTKEGDSEILIYASYLNSKSSGEVKAGIYKAVNEKYQVLKEDLDPNVIISYVTFENKLLIANGVNPVQVYDGKEISDLTSWQKISFPFNTNFEIKESDSEDSSIIHVTPAVENLDFQEFLAKDTQIQLVFERDIKTTCTILVVDQDPGVTKLRIVANKKIQGNIVQINYRNRLQNFSYVTVIKKRLWALGKGTASYKNNKFRDSFESMRVYYSYNLGSTGWFQDSNEDNDTGSLRFLDIRESGGAAINDNLQAIKVFEDNIIFFGKESAQIWSGGNLNPITESKDIEGKNSMNLFGWQYTLPIGLLHPNMILEVPNNLIFLSSYGIVSLNSDNNSRRLQVSWDFAKPISHHINSQLNFIENDTEFRSMNAFLYPYGKFLGFRIKYSCFIYQFNNGSWVVFDQNFSKSQNIIYDSISKNLYLGYSEGRILSYSDKFQQQSYKEYNQGFLSWSIVYHWTYFQTTWANAYFILDVKSANIMDIKIRIFENQDETESINEKIKILQQGSFYNLAQFDVDAYSYNESMFSYESTRFNADSMKIEISGNADHFFAFNRFILAGGNQ